MARYRIPAGLNFRAQTPIGQAISNLGTVFANLPTAEERAFNAARAANANAEAALNQNRLNAASGIADTFRRALTPGEGVDPETHFRTMLPEIAAIAANAGQYGQIGDMSRVVGANIAGATPRLQSNAMLGAGNPMSSTPVGHAAELDQRTRGDNIRAGATIAAARIASERAAELQDRIDQRTLEPVVDEQSGRTVLVPRAQAVGRVPAARPVSHAPRAPDNYMLPDGRSVLSADGQTYRDPETNEVRPMPSDARRVGMSVQGATPDALTPTQRGNAELNARSMERLQRTMLDAYNLSENPANFGATGSFRSLVQDIGQQADAALGYLSPEWRQRVEAARNTLTNTAGVPNFDATVPQLNMVLGVLPYLAAEAVAGQSGRGLSNEDVRRWERILGSGGPIANQAEFRARLQMLDNMIAREINASRRGAAPITSVLPQQAAPAGAPPPAGAGQPRRIRMDAQGNVVR